MKRIIILLVTAFVLSVNSCNVGGTQENKQGQEKQEENQFPQNMQSYGYYQLLGTYLEAVKNSSYYKSNKVLYDSNVFKPKEIVKIQSKIEKITKIPFGEKGLLKVTEYHIVSLPWMMFNFLFYVDDKEQLYFSDSSSADDSITKYILCERSGQKVEIKYIKDFFEYLESINNLTSVSFNTGYHFYADTNLLYITDNIKIIMELNEKKDKYFLGLVINGKSELYDFPKDKLGAPIYYNAKDKNITYKRDDHGIRLKMPGENERLVKNTIISIYDYQNEKIISKYLICMMEYYWHLGVDALGRIYYYRSPAYPYYETPNNKKTDYTAFEPRFNTGEIQIYDIETQTLTIIEHHFPEPEGAKAIWTFYVVQKDGTLYCQYILPDGNYIIKITPDWNSAVPYPEYKPTFLNEDWKK